MGSDDEEPSVHWGASNSVARQDLQERNLDALDRRPAIPEQAPPCALPAASPLFTNRDKELATLTACFSSEELSAPVAVLGGLSGAGASSVAWQWGHLHGKRFFPDGILYSDLDVRRAAGGVAAADIAGQLLAECEIDVPKETGARIERYRSYLNGRRILVVLDHVENVSEVRALQPSSGSCGLIVTTHHRDRYVTGQRSITVEPLDPDAARTLVVRMIGEERAEREPDEIAELIELCECVPEILILAFEEMERYQDISAAHALSWMRSELDRHPGPHDRKAVLDVVAGNAYKALSAQAARLYRFLGHHPGEDVSEEAILGAVGGDARRAISELRDHYLLEPHSAGRLRQTKLIKRHAQSVIADGEDTATEALAAWTKYYIGRAQAADRALTPDRNRVFDIEYPSARGFASDKLARDWFAANSSNLLELQRSLDKQWDFRSVLLLGEALWVHYIGALADLADFQECMRTCVDAAKAWKDPLAAATLVRFLAFLARALMENARNAVDPDATYAEAESILREAIAVPFTGGVGADVHASAVEFMGRLFQYQRRFVEAIEWYTRALELFTLRANDTSASDDERRANLRGVGLQHMFVGMVHLVTENHAAAEQSLLQAEARLRETSHHRDVAKVQTNLGRALRLLGRWDEAHVVLTKAVDALGGEEWFRIEADAFGELSLVAEGRGLRELERRCLERLRDLYSASHDTRLDDVSERLARLSGE